MKWYSGGASGVDTLVEYACDTYGVPIGICTFEGHVTPSKPKNRVILSEDELNSAADYVIDVRKNLHRTFPTPNKYSNNLLCRNYYIIKDVECVIAFCRLIGGRNIPDGTAWGIEMAKVRHIPIYIYDIDHFFIYQWNYNQFGKPDWIWLKFLPTLPYTTFAGIGVSGKIKATAQKNILHKLYAIIESAGYSRLKPKPITN